MTYREIHHKNAERAFPVLKQFVDAGNALVQRRGYDVLDVFEPSKLGRDVPIDGLHFDDVRCNTMQVLANHWLNMLCVPY